MFTPAISASRTSAPPCVIIVNAFWTQVMSPPFLNLFPFAEAITTGLTGFEFITVGACPKSARGVIANVSPPATLDCTKRRLFMLHPNTSGRRKPTPTSFLLFLHVPRQQDVMPQASIEVVSALTACPTTNHGCRLINTAALTMSGAESAIQHTAAKRNAPGNPPANTPPIRATRRKTVAIAMAARKVTAEEIV